MKRVLCILILVFVLGGCDFPTAPPEPLITSCVWILETEDGEIVTLDSPEAVIEWKQANFDTQYKLLEVICD